VVVIVVVVVVIVIVDIVAIDVVVVVVVFAAFVRLQPSFDFHIKCSNIIYIHYIYILFLCGQLSLLGFVCACLMISVI